jgi:DnaD/phage-associated family protein
VEREFSSRERSLDEVRDKKMPERQLSNFQAGKGVVSLSESLFTQAVPKIRDLAELKVVLYVSYLTLRKRDLTSQHREHPVTYKELEVETRRLSPELSEETLRQALDSAVQHGILLRSTSDIDGMLEEAYSLPAESRGEPVVNVFTLYEQNIGMITPMIAEELKEAERLYPPQWIEEAFKEAVTLNKRSWRYIARILQRWASEGKDSGEHKRDIKKSDPDKYIKGKYGHLVKR